MPFFSVIIPLYNKENYIENTLKSVLDQTFTDFEIIIVNDGSTDNGLQVAKRFNDSRIIIAEQQNQGVSVARNRGIELSKSDYITFIDADDYWYPHFLELMFKNIKKYPNQSVFAAAIEVETSKKIFEAQYSIEKTSDCETVNYFKASSKETVICTSCAVFHKNVFEKIGVFDTNIRSGQDIDLWIRIGLVYPVLFSWKISARYVFDAHSLSKNRSYTSSKLNFSKFEKYENTNHDLKKFLDLNRFSLCIKSKLAGDYSNFKEFYKAIDVTNLSFKKRFLLLLPTRFLKMLIALQRVLVNKGLLSSVFK